MQTFLVGLLGGAVGSLVTALLTHYFSSRRDIDSRRRAIIVEKLTAAFDAFDASTLKDPKQEILDLERAISNVQMFGSEELVRQTKAFCDDLKKNGRSDIRVFLEVLRSEIRREAGLRPLSQSLANIRFREVAQSIGSPHK